MVTASEYRVILQLIALIILIAIIFLDYISAVKLIETIILHKTAITCEIKLNAVSGNIL